MDDKLYADLALEFEERGYQWKLKNGTSVTPTEEDIKSEVDKAKAALYDSNMGSTVEVGRLIIQKETNTHFRIYLYIGDTR